MTARTTVFRGIGAVLKSLLLVAGVPIALGRLWSTGERHQADDPSQLLGAITIVLCVTLVLVAAMWIWASARLVRDLARALRSRGTSNPATWSAHWAGSIAALCVVLGVVYGATNGVADRPSSALLNNQQHSAIVASQAIGERATARPVLPRSDGPDERSTPSQPQLGAQTASMPFDDVLVLGISLLTALGVARRVRLLRRLTACFRQPGERSSALEEDAARLEACLAGLSSTGLLGQIEVANRALWTALRSRPVTEELPDIVLARVGPFGVELLLDAPIDPAPLPFRADREGRWWSLQSGLELEPSKIDGHGAGRFIPWLVPLGEDGTATYLLAVGPGTRLSIEGEQQLCSSLLASIVLALRVLPWTEELDIALFGLDPPPEAEQSYHIERCTSATLADLASSDRRPLRRRLDSLWEREPLIVVAEQQDLIDQQLLRSASKAAGVMGHVADPTCTLEVSKDRLVLQPLGVCLSPRFPTPDQLHLFDRLLGDCTTIKAPERADSELPVATLDLKQVCRRIELLKGGVAIDGTTDAISPRDAHRALELIAYLALHDHRCSFETVARALYGDRAFSKAASLEHICGAARSLLGGRTTGSPLLFIEDGDIVLDNSCVTDWELLRAETARARFLRPNQAIEVLVGALETVSGRPFSNDALVGYRWVITEGIAETMAATIVDAAHHVACLALAVNDNDRACWAIDKGRSIEPASEMLVRDLMACHDSRGEHDLVDEAFGELEIHLAQIFGNEPSLETRSYYEQLIDGRQHRI